MTCCYVIGGSILTEMKTYVHNKMPVSRRVINRTDNH